MVHSKIYTASATVSGVCPTKTEILPATSGYRATIKQIVGASKVGYVAALNLSQGDTPIAPQFTLGASGTLIWDNLGGGQGLPLEVGSGIFGCLDIPGEVDVTIYYEWEDQTTPITKEQARTASYNNVTVIRTPNRFGGQSKT